MMTSGKMRNEFIGFFQKKKHVYVESASLLPSDDPSVLFTTAGMQQFKQYFSGEKNPMEVFHSRRVVSIQRCIRTSDIDQVGDESHNTFFEMLGSFSFGDYFKREAIEWAWEFVTKKMKIDKRHLFATYFKGDKEIPQDEEAKSLWLRFLPKERLYGFGKLDNWWGPVGKSGPCGPCSEIHYDMRGTPCEKGDQCIPNCSCKRFLEVWNLVFTQYHMTESGKLKLLPAKNIDTGMGLERLALIVQKKSNVYQTDLFAPIIKAIQVDKSFGLTGGPEDIVRSRIVADHIKACIFLAFDGAFFSNKDQGYILRRLFRRAADQYSLPHLRFDNLVDIIATVYAPFVPYLKERSPRIKELFDQELENYQKVLKTSVVDALRKLRKEKKDSTISAPEPSGRTLSASEAFQLYTSYGISSDKLKREGFEFDEYEFNKLIEKHKQISRVGSEKKFGGHGLLDSTLPEKDRVQVTKLHTATHLLQQALRDMLGPIVRQEGSDITPERLRFDFRHNAKLTDDQKRKIENIVNQKIRENLEVRSEQMSYDDAMRKGALAFFKEKYPETVTVYSVGNYSKEICGGPHVKRTGEIGVLKIVSESSSGSGIRRIKAVVE